MAKQSDRLRKVATTLNTPEQILQMVKGPSQPRPEEAGPFAPPRTQTETQVATVWAEVLGLEAVGVDDDFFALGGYSLLITEILSRIHDLFNVEIQLSTWFAQSFTVGTLARQIELAQIGTASDADIRQVLALVEQLSDQDVVEMLDGQDKDSATRTTS